MYNGVGVWNRLYSWVTDASNGIKIRADRMDAEMNDMCANGFGLALTRDGQGQPTANLPMAGFKHTGVASGTARTHYASVGQLQDNAIMFAAAGGTADALTATFSPNTASLVDGEQHYVRAASANATTTPTYAPDGLTAHTITKAGGAALFKGDIAGANHELILRYNLANTRWELLNPKPNRGGAFTPTLTFGGGSTGMTGTFAGQYRELGAGAVWFSIKIILTAKGSSTGTASVGALPFTSSATANINSAPAILVDAMAAGVTNIVAQVGNNATTITFSNLAAGALTGLSDTSFTNTTSINITGVYSVD